MFNPYQQSIVDNIHRIEVNRKDDYDIEGNKFHVAVVGKHEIEVIPKRVENPDVELTFAPKVVEKLITFESEVEYATRFGLFF